MGSLFDLLTIPSAAVGLALGIGMAMLFHWLAPAGTDVVSAGAWFVGGGWALGLLWAAVFGSRPK